MFIDKAKIFISSGNGGDGSVSFRREKYVPNGGPDGGDGGDGGNVIFIVDNSMRTLLDFRYKKKYNADNGQNGSNSNCYGKNAQDLYIKVPPGTTIKNFETGEIIADLKLNNQEFIAAYGGKGGKGNAKFATATRQAPNFAETGKNGEEKWVVLELKLIADVGLIGFPNVGKSTILSMVTAAQPKIANYHFTTLEPNLGVVDLIEKESFVLADIPGLIEGAHQGAGLGYEFLRHIERTRLLIHVIDISGIEGRDPIDDFKKINEELKLYNIDLSNKVQIIALNKTDLPEATINIKRFNEFIGEYNYKVFEISAAKNSGLKELMYYAKDMLNKIPQEEYESKDDNSNYYKLQNRENKKDYEIKKQGDKYIIEGSFVDNIFKRVNIYDSESLKYFQKILRRKGIIDELKSMDIKNGQTVKMNDFEFDFIE